MFDSVRMFVPRLFILGLFVLGALTVFAAILASKSHVIGPLVEPAAQPGAHQIFERLDMACQHRFGSGYVFETNKCCNAASTCQPF